MDGDALYRTASQSALSHRRVGVGVMFDSKHWCGGASMGSHYSAFSLTPLADPTSLAAPSSRVGYLQSL